MVFQVIINKTNPDNMTVELFTDLRAMSDRFKILEDENQDVVITSAEV